MIKKCSLAVIGKVSAPASRIQVIQYRYNNQVPDLKFSCNIHARISDTDRTMEKRFVAPLTEPEQQTLTSAYHHGEKRALRRRAHAILLSDQGHTINQISEILQVRRDAVSRWFKQWEVSGLDGLIDKPRSGRTPVLDEHDHKRLQALVAEHPHQIRALQARFQEETGKSVATVTLRRALKKKWL
jgi:transposase